MTLVCISCGKNITPGEKHSKFKCPGCNEVVIVRCSKCKLFSSIYKCPKCGYEGP